MRKLFVVLLLASGCLSGCAYTAITATGILEEHAVGDATKAERMRRSVGPGRPVSLGLRGLVGDAKVSVGEFSSFDPGRKTYLCRVGAMVSPPGGVTYEQYLKNALIAQLKADGVYDDSSPVVLTGRVESMEYSSYSDYWSIGLKVTSSLGGSVSVVDKYQYDTSFWGGGLACDIVKKEIPFAVRSVIEKVVKEPSFASLFAPAR